MDMRKIGGRLPDALGSVRRSTDATGELTPEREWTPFGVEIGTAQAGLGYAGEWWDAAVGLQYLRARWYDPRVGVFTQEDPWQGIPEHPATLHRFAYVGNNPINDVDPSGHCRPGECVVLGGSGANELALQACKQFQPNAPLSECYLFQGAAWHAYFTGSKQGRQDYVNGTGPAAGEEGRYRAAVAREWSGYLFSKRGLTFEEDLRQWPNPYSYFQDSDLTVYAAIDAAVRIPGFVSLGCSTRRNNRAVDLGPDIYPIPDFPEQTSFVSVNDISIKVGPGGFKEDEADYIRKALNGDLDELEDTLICHDSTMCSYENKYGGNIMNWEDGHLAADPSFKWVGQLGSDISTTDLLPGDLLAYYNAPVDTSRYVLPQHSNRVLLPGADPIMFDKARFGYPFNWLPLSEVRQRYGDPTIFVYRHTP